MGRVAAFLVVIALGVLGIPAVLLFQAGVDWVADRIEAAWPGRTGAEARFWFRLLAPIVLSVVLLILLVVLVTGL